MVLGNVPVSCIIPHFTSQKIVVVPAETTADNDEILVDPDGGTPDIEKPSHVAFGTKIPIPDHVLKSRMVCTLNNVTIVYIVFLTHIHTVI